MNTNSIWKDNTEIPNYGDIVFYTKNLNSEDEIHFGRVNVKLKIIIIPQNLECHKFEDIIKWTWTNDYIKQFDFLTRMCELKEDCNKVYIQKLESQSNKIERLEKALKYSSEMLINICDELGITKIMENNNAE